MHQVMTPDLAEQGIRQTPLRRPDTPRRRRARDAALAQATILNVARSHFVSRGIAGARVDQIAAAAGYSKAMLYHYYGNKETLYAAVLAQACREIAAPQPTADWAVVGPVAALEAFVRGTAALLRRDPAILNLLALENLNEAAHLRSPMLLGDHPGLLTQLRDILEAGAVAGVFRAGIDPVHLHVALWSMIAHTVSNRFTLSATLGVDIASDAFLDQHVDVVVEMVIGLCTRSS